MITNCNYFKKLKTENITVRTAPKYQSEQLQNITVRTAPKYHSQNSSKISQSEQFQNITVRTAPKSISTCFPPVIKFKFGNDYC
jgi:hypothetical protein